MLFLYGLKKVANTAVNGKLPLAIGNPSTDLGNEGRGRLYNFSPHQKTERVEKHKEHNI